jgi:hypothetical protein
MNKLILLAILFLFNFNSISVAADVDCKDLKKFSAEYFKCKGNMIKEKTISKGQNIIQDTKDFQSKEWSEEKKKMIKVKDEINKTKKKVLDK